MEKKIYVIRHCQAVGQSPEAELTINGMNQSIKLSDFFSHIKIDRIITSPFLRAIQTIKPIVQSKQISLEMDTRLAERILSSRLYPDWFDKLEKTFIDLELKYEGGESSKEAMNRIVSLVDEVVKSNFENIIIVTHGNLMSLLLKYFNHEFGFEQWRNLSNPDVFVIHFKENQNIIERIWIDEKVVNK